VEFLKARQENLLERSKKFTDEADSLQKELEKYKGIDIKVLGWRVIEVIKNLINKGLTLAKEGEKLFAEINTQNKDVQNLQNYIAKSTKEGFKFSLPKLEEVTKPVSEILKPISTIVLVGAGLFIAFQLGLFRRR
jgi:phage-related minor tail protein